MADQRADETVEKKAAELTAAVLVWRTVVLLAARMAEWKVGKWVAAKVAQRAAH